MKQTILSLLLMLFSVTFCQTFIGIPDTNFEQALIEAGYDDNLDNYVKHLIFLILLTLTFHPKIFLI